MRFELNPEEYDAIENFFRLAEIEDVREVLCNFPAWNSGDWGREDSDRIDELLDRIDEEFVV